MNSTLERLKTKLNNGDLTRAEVNAAEPRIIRVLNGRSGINCALK